MTRGAHLSILLVVSLGACGSYVRSPSTSDVAMVPSVAGVSAALPPPSTPHANAAATRVTYRADLDSAVRAAIDRDLPAWVRRYESLHAHPELSLAEHATASLVATALGEAGY